MKVPPPKFMPIFAKHPYSYQMDTFINNKSKWMLNYLIFININTRKAYAYPLHGKGADTVIDAMKRFIDDAGEVFSITSDQDRAYLSKKVLEFIRSKSINYFNTEDNNHNVLGIINRFVRTIRDLAEGKTIDEAEMKKIIDSYNESPHESLDNRAPNDITLVDELEYIEEGWYWTRIRYRSIDPMSRRSHTSSIPKKGTNSSSVHQITQWIPIRDTSW